MKNILRLSLLSFFLLALPLKKAQALTVLTTTSLTNLNINSETLLTSGLSNSTTVMIQLDGPATSVDVGVFLVQNVTDSGTQVADLTVGPCTNSCQVLWNGLWLIDGTQGRMDGNFKFVVTATSNTVSAPYTIPTLLQITSIDLHDFVIAPSSSNGQATFPYNVGFNLAKAGLATVVIKNTVGGTVRTLAKNYPGIGEQTGPNVLSWDGTSDSGQPVPLAVYNFVFDATDPTNNDKAIERTVSVAVQSLASLNTDPQTLFEQNAYVYPDPVRNHQATFQILAVRAGATLTLKIYTIAGDLVLEETFNGITAGNYENYTWNANNQAGRAVGRGLYYYVVRENDPAGTLQTVKKMAVIQ